ncbi:2OG-Fe(II) oxygenase [Tabrizicola piscis]|uniref:2OG-Fe(II) oxygenase n=1 Tax=Tabrizicola piscis TaxID=2494374 RepID=A0A3S8UA92_9RHOB|nr:2OG-Fe(II) oxygenase [Tabrizicola piscis]AZL60503.1 2OG-Fe(II) oxygenase [Tabrizicola piscis]
MPAPMLSIDPANLILPIDAAREAGRQAAEAYRSRAPYPHGCYDNFLPPEILEKVRDELRSLPEAETFFNNPQEKLKSSYQPERLAFYTRSLFYALNSRSFLAFLEELTGIDGLIPDPYFAGGGIHVVSNGGHLDIHADFNHHGKLNLERRINVLIYLNKDWREEWGGSFEVWDNDMTAKVASFVPLFNRMCCFNTGSNTWHGNPEPVAHPNGEPRMSIALYYYTATWDESREGHSTLFKPRPGTIDKADRQSSRHRILQNILPPVIYRRIAKPLRRMGV